MATNITDTALEPLFTFMTYSLGKAEHTFHSIPGSAVLVRYIKSSHQNDPFRTLLELILVIFAVRTLLQSRTRAERAGKHFVQYSDKVCQGTKKAFGLANFNVHRKLMSLWMSGPQSHSHGP